MNDLSALVAEGLGQAVLAVLPLVVAGLLGAVVAGWLAARMGLQDPVAAGVLRGLAVLVALLLVADGLAQQARDIASDAWSQLSDVGRTEG
ncbi:MAG: hypothetical protein K0V04_08140 [Deltaproteobacteria bacterium]|nr:hypothetical protein [Deltaproteobacteria bacterium]